MTRTGLIALLGATMLCAAPACAAELVTNGGFEADPADGSAITSWTVTGSGVIDDQIFVNTGSHDAAFLDTADDPANGVLSQDLATTAGTDYQLSFWLLDEASDPGDTFTVSFGGFTTVITGDQPGPFFGSVFTFDVAGSNITGASTTLSFQGGLDPATQNFQPINLDDVSVTGAAAGVVPEPAAWTLMLSGFFGIGWALRRRPLAATAPS
jgi:hypothetical protein